MARNVEVVIVVLGGYVEPELHRAATRLDIPIAQTASVATACRELLRSCADLVIVQVPCIPDQALELIEWLSSAVRRIPVIAVTVAHNEQVEVAVRQRGAASYLPCSELHHLGETVDALSRRVQRNVLFNQGCAPRREPQ